ncbi:MAG: sulfurtransferase [Halioglobus sp.]|nr:sulfurtransferase [Halioglobus sp.]
MLIEPGEFARGCNAIIFDCRFSLADPEAGRESYEREHVPGAHYLDLNRDLAGPLGEHGGRHPLPDPAVFAATLARFGVGADSDVVAYDDSRLAFAARLWWLMRALGYRPPRLLNGGYEGFLKAGGQPETGVPPVQSREPMPVGDYAGYCDIDGLRDLQAGGALLVDSREPRRYEGLEEPIDPVAGHIPGAINRPWQGVTTADSNVLGTAELQSHWGDALDAGQLVVYCGSGVTACVNLFSLALSGREDATLYAGSWSDWCSYL